MPKYIVFISRKNKQQMDFVCMGGAEDGSHTSPTLTMHSTTELHPSHTNGILQKGAEQS